MYSNKRPPNILMTKRIISALLCALVLVTVLTVPAFAASNNYLDKSIADIKLYADEQVLLGREFVVTVYIENITNTNGIVSNDLPLYYDRDKISISSVEPIYPVEWNGLGDMFSQTDFKDYPHYLRSLPDTMDLMINPAYRITDSKKIGYKVTFKANKLGEAFVAIENTKDNKSPIMMVVIEGEDVNNYSGTGMRISVDIVEKFQGDVSYDVSGDVSTDVSTDVSKPQGDDSGELVSSEASDDSVETSDEISDETSVEQPTTSSGSSFTLSGIFSGLLGLGAVGVVIIVALALACVALLAGIVVLIVFLVKKKK